MLLRLAIRDVVLIDRLDLDLSGGLSVLTGETGAGKSILLDSLGLATGARADLALIRRDTQQASVTAEFAIAADHPVFALLREREIDVEPTDGLILRRVITAEGRSRASVNDQAVSVALLREIGQLLVEIHGQFAEQGLLNPVGHCPLLDAFGRLAGLAQTVAEAHRLWREATRRREAALAKAEAAAREEAFLRHARAELAALDPQPGEEAALAERRGLLQRRERLVAGIAGALAAISGEHSAARSVSSAERQLARLSGDLGDLLGPAIAALERAGAEIAEAEAQLTELANSERFAEDQAEAVEERLFALRALARKHQISVDDLPSLRAQIEAQLDALDASSDAMRQFSMVEAASKQNFIAAAERLSAQRRAAAATLDEAVMRELAPLKLERARFLTRIETLEEAGWNASGIDRVAFLIATHPGAEPGPLQRIASGGELARFMLALRLVLAATGSAPTLVFDEVDSGIGGAVAAAVGDRLARLGQSLQVLVVTHSPQVAARGAHHWRVVKRLDPGGATTRIEALGPEARREEIARMLSGREVTDEARAAADRLMAWAS